MKKFLMTTAFVAAASGFASAQEAVNVIRTSPAALEIYASDLIGMRVYREEGDAGADGYAGVQTEWDDIGEIGDLILNREGQVDAVIIDVGGFLGMGETPVAVEMETIRFVQEEGTEDPEDYFLVLNVPRNVFENAQPYDRTAEVMPATETETVATTETAATTEAEVAANTTEMTETTEAAMTADAEGYVAVMASDLTSEQLTGVSVYGPNDERIGEISDILLTAEGKVEGAVVDVGGFLGIAEKPVALNFADVDVMKEADGDDLMVRVGMTKEELEALPEYEG